ncbi:MAG: class I SAM-dependent methyltransferase [Alphaproteobacteria bacterium]|nr:class I SAM-dependent methyltransferase [Alphaproteobacteria bacterium]
MSQPVLAENKDAFSKRPNHNLKPGHIECCQICGSKNLEVVLDLGHQPLCDSLLYKEDLQKPETFYPLRQVWCKDCTLNQIDYVVDGAVVYHQDYPYKSGVTKELVTYQNKMAEDIVTDLSIPQGSLIADIGSNDGTLLKGFKNQGMNVIGIEPTNIAEIASQDGINTLHSPFNQKIAQEIVRNYGHAQVVTATNVFAHMATLGDVMEGLEILVDDAGYFCFENHYLGAIADRMQYDTIYHEHLRSYSLHSLIKLFEYYDFTIVDAMKVSRYGGNIRVYAAKGKNHTPKASVQKMLEDEIKVGMTTPEYYQDFRERSVKLKNDFVSLLLRLRSEGYSVVGNSCPGRCSTLLNYAGIGPEILPYLAEQPASLKLGRYLPGKHIPIINNEILLQEQPDYVVLLAWHYADSIIEQLRARGLKSKFIMPMPEVRIID